MIEGCDLTIKAYNGDTYGRNCKLHKQTAIAQAGSPDPAGDFPIPLRGRYDLLSIDDGRAVCQSGEKFAALRTVKRGKA